MSETEAIEQPGSLWKRLSRWIVPALIFLFAIAIILLIAGHWNVWANENSLQETDDAYTRADLTP